MGSHHDLFEDIIPHKMSVMQRSISTHFFNNQLRYHATICLKYSENIHWPPGCDPNSLNIKQVCKPPVLCFCTNY